MAKLNSKKRKKIFVLRRKKFGRIDSSKKSLDWIGHKELVGEMLIAILKTRQF
jgi:hypothetical protein